ncbi:LOW QUALITY PROTEIN: uncharacterized protein LOC121950890 [Plectropomus leopardus]|uniref:LOW QUALITY PROTEIN: uncharacterized protein LOC121950890 n=1 Tax=Plectropomus leopardus TaxID=160734 RepID=UPI001C4DB41D|nr:LOW QUALITY PROTEIN: uncharacterized protein LOC121950890 [Plectropomus leopardus]
MAPRKCFYRCTGNATLFSFPTEPSVRKKWIDFVFAGKPQKYATVFICSRHFTDDCFLNKARYDTGFAVRLTLKEGAFPSIQGLLQDPIASTSTHVHSKYINRACQVDPVLTVCRETQCCPHMASVGTQVFWHPSTKCAATQLSYNTLKAHVRSKGTQVIVSCLSTQQDTGLELSSTSAKGLPLAPSGSRPAKRPRHEGEEEAVEPHDFTNQPGDSVTEPSEIRHAKSLPKPAVIDPQNKDQQSLSQQVQQKDKTAEDGDKRTDAPGAAPEAGMCSVEGCNSWHRCVPRFKIPEDPERRLEWVQFILKVNDHGVKESSWTDITICGDHFTEDCIIRLTETGTVELESSAVPSLWIKSEPEEAELKQEPEEPVEIALQCDLPEICENPSSSSKESQQTAAAAQKSPAPCEASEDFMSDFLQMLQKVGNISVIRKKAALLRKKKKYVVNEKRLLQLFSHKCPLCGSKVKTEKVTYGLLLILNQQCIKCTYRNQWKSQVNASNPAAEDEHLREAVEVDLTPKTQQTGSTDDNCSTVAGMSEIDAVIDERSDSMDESEESGDEGDTASDGDWNPEEEISLACELLDESEEESGDEGEDIPVRYSQLCAECGRFFHHQKTHTCEYKIKPYSCNICGKRCVNEIAMTAHSRIHDENYEFKCKYCHTTFKTKADKITHEQIHVNEEKPYKCPDCSEMFATNKQRRIHRKDHGGPRLFTCHICGMEFTRKISIKRHLLVHTGVRQHKCSVCDRGFNQASHLKSHMRLHTGERPFKCQHCDKSFTHNVSLKSHVERYHSSNSRRGQKKGKRHKTVSSAADAEDNGSQRDADSGLHTVEKHDKEENVRTETKGKSKTIYKKRYRSTGRPLGRPKRNTAVNVVLAGEMQGQHSNTKTAKSKAQKLKRRRGGDEESEDEPTESEMSFDSAEEEEEDSEKKSSSTSRSRGRANNPDSNSDFNPEKERKKKRGSSQNSGIKKNMTNKKE